ncbi:MAG: glutathione peroxidase [Anaerolineae bacterium]|nr:MAG: glutathione peroxidase [Anaerolineae bacterium]
MTTIYDFYVEDAQGNLHSLEQYKGKVLLIVNTASHCGFTPQYKGLQALYDEWHEKGLEILAFPCNQFGEQEPEENSVIQQFCQRNYNVKFPVFAKIDVNGPNAHPLYKYLRSQKRTILGDSISWNFTKFLVDQHGNVVKRFEPSFEPEKIGSDIKRLLDNR